MKMVYSNENHFLVNNAKNIVETEGIAVFVKNEFAQGAVGELSAVDAWPELWICDDSEFERVQELLASQLQQRLGADWVCQQCKEVNASSFDICWQCQHEAD